MISKSDIVILILASSALAVGIFRWHQNTQNVSAITIPASSRAASSPTVAEPNQGNTLVAANTANNSAVNSVNLAEPAVTATAQASTGSQTQTLPQAEVVATPVVKPIVIAASTDSTEAISVGRHQVQSGDYLGKIASQYGTDVQTLRDLNNISGSIIQIGQEILYPL